MTIPPRRSRDVPPIPLQTHLPDAVTLAADEAVARFPFLLDQCDPADAGVEEVVVYPGQIYIESIGTLAGPDERRFVVFTGPVWVERAFTQGVSQDDDAYLAVFVDGSLFAGDVAMSGDGKLWVRDTLEVQDLVIAGGGSDGFIHVANRLGARVVAATAYNQISAGSIDGVAIGGEHAIRPRRDHERADAILDAFEPHALDDGRLDVRACARALRAGKRVLR
jgi:hypothetical protein